MADANNTQKIINFPVQWGGALQVLPEQLKEHFQNTLGNEGKAHKISNLELLSRQAIDLDQDGQSDVFIAKGFFMADYREAGGRHFYDYSHFSVFVDKTGKVLFDTENGKWTSLSLTQHGSVNGHYEVKQKYLEQIRSKVSEKLTEDMKSLEERVRKNPQIFAGAIAFSFNPPPLCQTALVNLLSATLNPWELLSYFLLVKPFPKECR